ncbi:DHA2 family efflux MFS transporter permease subunit [Rhizorhapis suberifaciens]|nr:DHA2 family efflux MFS transporter permease subunit [Rhizorhapis suberifaciens]
MPPAHGKSTWWCFIGLLVAQFIAVLDVQIVTSSLEMIQAGVGASVDEISWVQTSYLIAETLSIPLVGSLTRRLGLRTLFGIACGAFVLFSLAVGTAQSLPMLIVARALQGCAGGVMLPMAFTYGFTAFPEALKPRISLILALFSVSAPAIGPVLGGYISDAAGWRWLFFVNVMPGLLAILAVTRSISATEGRVSPAPPLDWGSLVALSACLASIQFALEEGQRRNWTEDGWICALMVLGAVGLLAFVRRSMVAKDPLIDLRPLLAHAFRTGWLLVTVSGVSIFGGSYLLPLFLANVRGYSPIQVGETLMVSGVSMIIAGLVLMPRLSRVDPRLLMGGGFAMAGYAFWLGQAATAQWDFWEFATMQILRGIGLIVAVTTTQSLTMKGVDAGQVSSATSLLYLARNLGGAFGVALLSSELVVASHQAYADLSASYRVVAGPHAAPGDNAVPIAALNDAALVLGFNRCFALTALYCWGAAILAFTLRGRIAAAAPDRS